MDKTDGSIIVEFTSENNQFERLNAVGHILNICDLNAFLFTRYVSLENIEFHYATLYGYILMSDYKYIDNAKFFLVSPIPNPKI